MSQYMMWLALAASIIESCFKKDKSRSARIFPGIGQNLAIVFFIREGLIKQRMTCPCVWHWHKTTCNNIYSIAFILEKKSLKH